jgi:hypothetical protein
VAVQEHQVKVIMGVMEAALAAAVKVPAEVAAVQVLLAEI